METRKKILCVFGTRPEAIKIAPVIRELEKNNDIFEVVTVVTGQHRELLDEALYLFQVQPDYDLNVMAKRQTLSEITSWVMHGLEKIFLKEQPDLVLIQGDSATAFTTALTAFYHRIPLGHVEAGLRSGQKYSPYPEEMHRRLITSLADVHFAPTALAVESLKASSVNPANIYLTGNTIIDALLSIAQTDYNLEKVVDVRPSQGKKVLLVTAHRRESFGMPLRNICQALKTLSEKRKDIHIILPVHKNPIVRETVNSLLANQSGLQLIEPLDYEPFIHLMKLCYLILTDSGGIQEEAPTLGKPVLLLRQTTERPESVMAGTVKFVGTDPDKIVAEVSQLLDDAAAYAAMARKVNPYGDGQAAGRIVKALLHYFGFVDKKPASFQPETAGVAKRS